MRVVYAVIAWIVAGGVVVQAASIAFGLGGMVHFVQEGGVIDKALVESRQGSFEGELGFPIHAIVGGGVIPLAALTLVVVSFFVRARGAKLWALVVLGLVVLQVSLGYSIPDAPWAGLVHGANALAVLLAAVFAALRIRNAPAVPRRAAGLHRTADATPNADAVST
ncbi:hypothetical protein ACH3VR_02950 [Microbacterium sp. B2969]|uniref:Uncharacterized protein n=1 Tax=Microbacterium alkaliflavum TaxID=3248839 RepID=A0ABW7Q391_9MICO